MSESRTYRVLVVEDKCDDALLIEEAFAECGYLCDVQFAASSSQALNLLSTAPFDLILTDFGTDSEEARRSLHSIHAVAKRMPIVASGVLYASAAVHNGTSSLHLDQATMCLPSGDHRGYPLLVDLRCVS